MRPLTAALGTGLLLFAAGAINAATPLSERDVTEVIATMRALTPIVTKNRAAMEQYLRAQKGSADSRKDPCEQAPDARNLPGHADAERVVKEHGFSGGEQYCRTSLRVFAACGVLRADQEHPDWRQNLGKRDEQIAQARAQMTRMLKDLDGENDMSGEQKEQLRKQLTQMLKNLDNPAVNPLMDMVESVSDADKAAVASHCAELESVARDLAERSRPAPAPQ